MEAKKITPAYLVLEDGTVYEGFSLGAVKKAIGEVVFNTTVSYQDILSDPTYSGQIVIQTYPLIGNRGVDPQSVTNLVASGYVVREWCVEPTDANEFVTLDQYLDGIGVTGLCGIDTRSLTRRIRGYGVMNGAIVDSLDHKEELLQELKAYQVPPAVGQVSVKQVERIETPGAEVEIAVPDYGFRRDILAHFAKRGCNITLYPAYTPSEEILASNPDGILLSDGPGDPWDNPEIIGIIRELVSAKKPIFAVGLGHQLLAVAMGMSIEKLPVGHRGANQPARRLDNGRVLITSQNHGYTVDRNTVSPDVAAVTHENVNDRTVEGLSYKAFPSVSVQFEPTDGMGYQDTAYLFDAYIEMIERGNVNA